MKYALRFSIDVLAGAFFGLGALAIGASLLQSIFAIVVLGFYGAWCFTDGTGLLWRK